MKESSIFYSSEWSSLDQEEHLLLGLFTSIGRTRPILPEWEHLSQSLPDLYYSAINLLPLWIWWRMIPHFHIQSAWRSIISFRCAYPPEGPDHPCGQPWQTTVRVWNGVTGRAVADSRTGSRCQLWRGFWPPRIPFWTPLPPASTAPVSIK